MQITESLTIVNLSPSLDLNVFSIQTDSIHFHSLSKPRVIPPHGHATFLLAFLPRSLGLIEASFLIKTDTGSYSYQVKTQSDFLPKSFIHLFIFLGERHRHTQPFQDKACYWYQGPCWCAIHNAHRIL